MPPTTILCIGMAGCGKTTFMQRLNLHLHSRKQPPYVINLDPAVLSVPYGPNIDIRDSVKYKNVMAEYNLGPNGAIVTSLNLFSTKIDQVIKLVENKASSLSHTIIDTPGQIECFVWLASGAIVTEAFALTFPTVIAYIVDTPRNTLPATFMSNMLYACSILYKMKLPMIIVFNKTDVKDADFAIEWMRDFELFQLALKDDDLGYMGSLVSSMSLMLEEFYSHLDVLAVSAYTGAGFDAFLDSVDKKVAEYNDFYLAERERILRQKADDEKRRKAESLSKLMGDLDLGVLSDYEGEIDPDEPEREYTFDRNEKTDPATEAIARHINGV